MAQTSFGIGRIQINTTGRIIRLKSKTYAGFTIYNESPGQVLLVVVNKVITGASGVAGLGVDDTADAAGVDADFESVTALWMSKNGIAIYPGQRVQFSAYQPRLGDPGLRRISVIAAASTTYIMGGTNDLV
jgi:hypothetical protein